MRGVIRKQTYLTPELDRAVKTLSRTRGVSEAEIIQRAVADFVERTQAYTTGDPFDELVGYINEGLPTDVAEYHDKYLYGKHE